MRPRALVPLVLLLAGALLVLDAVARGGASVALVVVVPVLFGGSAEFFLGVALVFVGFVTLPWALGYSFEAGEEAPTTEHGGAPPTEVAGLILIGPIPIFFGRGSRVSKRTRVLAAVLGGLLVVGLVVVLLVVR